jgi:uncharacterized membrane protein YheB (UPF0754 family)
MGGREAMKIELNIDVDKITKDMLDKELYEESYKYSIKRTVEQEIREGIKQSVLHEIRQNLEPFKLKENGYSKEWMKKEAKDILDKELSTVLKDHVESWMKANLIHFIDANARKYLESKFLPFLQKVVDSLIVVNEQSITEAQNEFDKWIQEAQDSAYEAGQADCAKEIRSSI